MPGSLGGKLCRSLWAPLLIHLAYDLGMFFGFSMFLADQNPMWFCSYIVSALIAVVAGIFAFFEWWRLHSLVNSQDTPVASFHELGTEDADTVV